MLVFFVCLPFIVLVENKRLEAPYRRCMCASTICICQIDRFLNVFPLALAVDVSLKNDCSCDTFSVNLSTNVDRKIVQKNHDPH